MIFTRSNLCMRLNGEGERVNEKIGIYGKYSLSKYKVWGEKKHRNIFALILGVSLFLPITNNLLMTYVDV